MESCTPTHDLISSLPEIISKIMEFLPTPDLESASLVNSTWEKEALRHLVVRSPVNVHLLNVSDSMDLVPLRNLSPTHLKVVVRVRSPEENAEILLSKIKLFTAINFSTVTKFSIHVRLENTLRHAASRLVKIHESFKNLRSLEFKMIVDNSKELFSSDVHWADLFPDSPINSRVAPRLTTLTINIFALLLVKVVEDNLDQWIQSDNVISLTTRILTVFSHVQNLKMIDTPGGLIQEGGLILPHLKSISLLRKFDIDHYGPLANLFEFKAPLSPSFANVTRLEISAVISDTTNGVDILHLLAPQLEHVCISEVENSYPDAELDSNRFITIPILPRLKVFEILRDKFLFNCHEVNWFRPYLYLDFETERDEVKLVYEKQFPALEKLIVRVAREMLPVLSHVDLRPGENLHFEATMLFLYETFLAEGVSPCETLTSLDISFPTEECYVGHMKMKLRYGEDYIWGWEEEVPDFYTRISTIFPNVDYHMVERGKEVVRMVRLERFKEMGVALGIFEDEGGIGYFRFVSSEVKKIPDEQNSAKASSWVWFAVKVVIELIIAIGTIFEYMYLY